jgi:uncharacterized membrane protein
MTGTTASRTRAPAAGQDNGVRRDGARLIGVDAARGLAVFGMIMVHVAPAFAAGGAGTVDMVGRTLVGLAEGRSAILFAVLAGVSLGLLSGGARGLAEHRRGTRRHGDRARIAVRAAILFALGVALAAISTGPIVILCFYAVLFVMALPLLWLRPAALLAWAAAWTLAGPQVSYLLRGMITSTGVVGGAVTPDHFTSWSAAGDGAMLLVLTGTYPVATWMPFVLVGLAIGRLDLRSAGVQARLAAAGVAAAVLGYGGSWLALEVLGGRAALVAAVAPVAGEIGTPPEQLVDTLTTLPGMGTTGLLSPALLLVDRPHTGTTFEIVGSAGVAVAVLATFLLLAGRGRVGAALLWPVAAAGAMAATLYAGHIAALAVLTVAGVGPGHPWLVTLLFVVAAVALGSGWRRWIGRGPVEWMMHILSTGAARRVR